MMDGIRSRLLHFETDGDVIQDFVAARIKKAAALRRVTHVCFYAQCVLSAACIMVALMLGTMMFAKLFACIAGVLAIVVAFFALGGGGTEKTVSYIMDLIYAVVSFSLGGIDMYICGGLMLAAALAALISFFADQARKFLLDYSPLKLRRSDYTLIPSTKPQQVLPDEPPAPPPPPEKSELMEVAEQFMEIFK